MKWFKLLKLIWLIPRNIIVVPIATILWVIDEIGMER